MMKRNGHWLAILTLTCGTASWADGPGVRPRLNAQAYPASAALAQGSVAAAALSRTDVRNSFAVDLNKGYLVFEVSFYPNAAGQMRISPTDFMLKVTQQDDPIRPAEPAVVASAIADKNTPKRASAGGVTVVPVATVGYETGTDINNPNNNGQRHSGVYTSVGVAVAGGVGPGGGPGYPGPSTDRYSMEAELFDKSLPEGPITKPTAGYVYFPAPKGKQKAGVAYELQYTGEAGVTKLAVPVPHEK